jgi:hypothetical protein
MTVTVRSSGVANMPQFFVEVFAYIRETPSKAAVALEEFPIRTRDRDNVSAELFAQNGVDVISNLNY